MPLFDYLRSEFGNRVNDVNRPPLSYVLTPLEFLWSLNTKLTDCATAKPAGTATRMASF